MTSAPFIVAEGDRRVCTILFCDVKGREHLVDGWPNERVPSRKHQAAVAATGDV